VNLERQIEIHLAAVPKINFDPADIHLVTDFGQSDASVSMMVGVMRRIANRSQCYQWPQMPAFEIDTTAFLLEVNNPVYFAKGTVFCVVVDPGVGTNRDAVAIKAGDMYYVGPNNGVFSKVVTVNTFQKAVRLDNPMFHLLPSVSETYHGRDIFAPVAAHIANGMELSEIGTSINYDDLMKINQTVSNKEESGSIVLIDDFGSLVTNITKKVFQTFTTGCDWQITIEVNRSTIVEQDRPVITEITRTFGDGDPDRLIALFGGDFVNINGVPYMTIALNMGSAQKVTGAKIGDKIKICLS